MRYTDQELVMQVWLHMDIDLKDAIDTNSKYQWCLFIVDEALDSISELIKQLSSLPVYRIEETLMSWNRKQMRGEFIMRLKACSPDCDFVWPYEATHDLTNYHIINHIHSRIHDTQVQQELVQKSDSLKNVTAFLNYWESFQSARHDQDKLTNNKKAVGVIEEPQNSLEEQDKNLKKRTLNLL